MNSCQRPKCFGLLQIPGLHVFEEFDKVSLPSIYYAFYVILPVSDTLAHFVLASIIRLLSLSISARSFEWILALIGLTGLGPFLIQPQ
jgi:hypothetical protein